MRTATPVPSHDRLADRLRRGMRGEVVVPGDPRYDDARTVFNGAIDRRPAVIARCRDVEDVVAVLAAARDSGLPLAVRGGGHSMAGLSVCDGGIVLDLAPLRRIAINAERGVVVAGAGLRLGELDRETQRFGLAVPAGTISDTGLAGLALGGGQGWLMRRHGLTIDNLLGAEVVTADGRVLHVSADVDPDLFWALRGGGGNFGVVTSFTFRAHRVSVVLGGLMAFDGARTAEVLAASRELMRDASDDLTVFNVPMTAPPHGPFPPALQGRPALGLGLCHIGPDDIAAAEVARFRALGPDLDLVGPMPYAALQSMLDETAPPGRGYVNTSVQLDDLSDGAIGVLVDAMRHAPGPFAHVLVPTLGGAVARIAPEATAYPHRSSPYLAWCVSAWLPADDAAEADRHAAWARAVRLALRPYGDGVYVNALGTETDRLGEAYGPNLARLREVKRRFGPANLFRRNANILPAAVDG
jgi:FAD/FMN-containing dehydrogenase